MYNYFSMVAIRQPVVYVPHYVAKFAFHPTQLSAQPSQLQAMLPQLMASFDMIADSPDVPDFVPGLRQRAYAGFHLIMVPGLMKNGYYDEAEKLLRKAMEYEPDPGFLKGVINGGIYILNEKWKFHRTIAFIDMALEWGLSYSTLHYFKALAYDRIGDSAKAVTCMKQQVATFPEDRNSVYRLVKLQLYKLVERPEMKKALEAFGERGPRVTNLREYADRVHRIIFTKNVYRKGIYANQHGPESMLGLYDLFLAHCGKEDELCARLEGDRYFLMSFFDM
jgi:tetratricopeptide (TPR) repeat protein